MMRNTGWLLRDRKRGVSTDKLWAIVIIASVFCVTALIPQSPNDFWWHIKIGEYISQNGSIPSTSMYSWSISADTPFVYGAWLGEYLMYTAYNLGDVALLMLTRTLLLVVTIMLVVQQAWLRTKSWRLAALAAALAYGMSLNNLIVRPQNWSWIPFMLLIAVLQGYKSKRLSWKWLLVIPLIMVFWANAHGAFILGIVLCGAYAVGETARHFIHQPDILGKTALIRLWLLVVLVTLAIVVTPQGFGTFKYVYNLMTDQPSQGLIVEWQSPSPSGLPNVLFYGSILLFLVVLWFSKRRPDLTDMLIVLGFTWLAWTGMRYVVWYGLIAMPVMVDYLQDLIPVRFLRSSSQQNLLNNILVTLICVPVFMTLPWFVSSITKLMPQSYIDMLAVNDSYGPMQSVETPIEVIDFLKDNPVENVYHEMGYGSFFIWALPEQDVFVDPRVELYPYEMWLDYIRIMKGIRYNQLLDEYHVDRVVLDTEIQPELLKALELDDSWIQVYADPRTQVWDRAETP